ncbi:hypothetical protein ASD24_15080 [Paenibacillus sp. Root52]|uniref:hypothetical protein n=1 Tax=Paenibacillus sp. Root52 TaxID=1736552 RepID=UPI0006F1CC30|nr:hypothetical protein [Paenibacillus sp. Root52]KQY82702.1 hypothetical protein ASD24_15080 [Paenibacillus sp. Root52]
MKKSNIIFILAIILILGGSLFAKNLYDKKSNEDTLDNLVLDKIAGNTITSIDIAHYLENDISTEKTVTDPNEIKAIIEEFENKRVEKSSSLKEVDKEESYSLHLKTEQGTIFIIILYANNYTLLFNEISNINKDGTYKMIDSINKDKIVEMFNP